jgi:hypothetical protein
MLYKYTFLGTAAGGIATLVFTWVHEVTISNIWNTFPIMLMAGALCGTLIAWSHFILVKQVNVVSWLMYNLIYFLMFVLLSVLSVLIYDPVTTVAEVIALNQAPTHLISRVIPLMVVFLVSMTLIIGFLFKATGKSHLAVLVTCFVLIIFLGTNVAVLGLVEVPKTSYYLIVNFFGLQLVLVITYAISFWILAQGILHSKK